MRDIEVSWHKQHPESDDVPGGDYGVRPAELPRRTLRAEHRDLLDVFRVLVPDAEAGQPAERARRSLGGALGAHEQMLGLLALCPRSGGDRHPGASSEILREFVP